MTNRTADGSLSDETLNSYTCSRTDLLSLVPHDARNILEIGCSDGNLGAAVKARSKNQARVIGIEIEPNLAAKAKTKIDYVFTGDIEEFDFHLLGSFTPFDCIVLGDVLEHLRDPDSLLEHLSATLGENCVMVSSLPNIRHLSALFSIVCEGTFPRRPRGIFDQTHLRWFTIRDTRQLFESKGYFIEREIFNLRAWDKGGGLLNRALDRIPQWLSRLPPLREFLTYQYTLRVRLSGHPKNT